MCVKYSIKMTRAQLEKNLANMGMEENKPGVWVKKGIDGEIVFTARIKEEK